MAIIDVAVAALADAAVDYGVADVVGSVVADSVGAAVTDGIAGGVVDSLVTDGITTLADGSIVDAVTGEAVSAADAAAWEGGFQGTEALTSANAGVPAGYVDSASALSSPAAQQIKNLIPGISNGQLLSMLGNVVGTGIKSSAASKAGSQGAAASAAAANVLSPAALQAAKLQADAATQAGQTLSDASLGAGKTLSDASLNAANQKVGGLNNALSVAGNVLSMQEGLQAPILGAGAAALSELSADLKPGGKFNRAFTMADAQNMPAYQFALEQGLGAARNAESAGGMQLSSNAIHDQTKFAEGTAAQYENQAFNQWMSENQLSLGALQEMVRTGQVSVGQLAAELQNYGVSAETLHSAMGNAAAAGTTGSGNALAQGAMGSANALAAGQVGSAGYTAQGVSNSAQAVANGITGSANSKIAGNVASDNIIGNGVSSIGNLLAQGFAPTATKTAPAPAPAAPVAGNPAAPSTTTDTYTAPPYQYSGPDYPFTMDSYA